MGRVPRKTHGSISVGRNPCCDIFLAIRYLLNPFRPYLPLSLSSALQMPYFPRCRHLTLCRPSKQCPLRNNPLCRPRPRRRSCSESCRITSRCPPILLDEAHRSVLRPPNPILFTDSYIVFLILMGYASHRLRARRRIDHNKAVWSCNGVTE